VPLDGGHNYLNYNSREKEGVKLILKKEEKQQVPMHNEDKNKGEEISRRKEEAKEKWRKTKELYEKYPKIIEALRKGRYFKEYERMIREVAKLYGRGHMNEKE